MSSIIKRAAVRSAEAAEGPALPQAGGRARPRGAHSKRIELVRVGQRVHALELTCACGETTLIELDYPDEDSPNGAAR